MIVDCPRNAIDNEDPRWCPGGTFELQQYTDSEGDPGVIGGFHVFTAWEVEKQTCKCELTVEEEEELFDEARRRYESR